MKKIILLVAVITLSSCALMQNIPSEDLKQSKIIEDLKQSKTELYLKANNWMVGVFNDAENVIQFSDKDSGTLTGKYLVNGGLIYLDGIPMDSRIFAIIKMKLKDNRANISIEMPTGSRATNPQIIDIKRKVSLLIIDFEESLRTNKDW